MITVTEDDWDVTYCGECDKPIQCGDFTSTRYGLVCHLNCAVEAMNNECD